jgi:hypothetical protein
MKIHWTHNRTLGVFLDRYMVHYSYTYVNNERSLATKCNYWSLQIGFGFRTLLIMFNRPKLNEN